MKYLSDHEAKQLILEIGRKMSMTGFVAANDGNLTIRVDDDAIWATPTGVNKGDLREEMLIKTRISDGTILEGTWKPTTEINMHLNIYRTDDTVVSTAHAHPLNMCVLACAGIDLDLPITATAAAIVGVVPIVPYACCGGMDLAESVIPYVKQYKAVNLANHGPIAWGHTPREAWYRLEASESSARLALELLRLGRLRPLSADQVEEILVTHDINWPETAKMKRFTETNNHLPGTSMAALFRENKGNQ